MNLIFKALIFIFTLTISAYRVLALDVYVSPTGNDNNDGSLDSPLKTLSAAFEKVKGTASGTTIWLREGIYDVRELIPLSSSHSGTNGSPFVVSSYPGEQAIINGGLTIPASKFKVLNNATRLNRIPEVARGQVYVAQLYESQFSSQFPPKQEYNKSALVSWSGYVLNEAQYPNRGYAYIQDILAKGPTTRWLEPGEEPAAYSETTPTGGKFTIREQLNWDMMSDEFKRTHDMLIRGYFHNDWFFQTERIGDVENDGSIKLLRYTRYGIVDEQRLPRRVNIYGALCQLDEPGEWYFDKAENLLYIWPVQPITDDKPVILSGKHGLLECTERLENVSFKNLIFENFSDHALRLVNAGHVKVLGCEFRSGNGAGVRLQGNNNLIQSCDFHDSKGAFMLSTADSKNVKNLVNENNVAINNHIHHLWNRGYGGCSIGGVGTRFAHNLIHDTNGALVYGNNDCIVEYNEFYNMGYEMGDWNPMYRGADFTSLGNQVRYNFVHHLMETPYGYPVAGIRNDDYGHGLSVHHNIFFKSGRSAVMFRGANNCFSNNIVLETSMLWWTNQNPYEKLDKSLWDSKGDYLDRRYQEYLEKQEKVAAGTLNPNEKDNYLGRAELKLGKEFWKNNELWRNHYPVIDSLYHFDDPDRNPWMQCYDTLVNNVMVKGNSYPFHMHGPNDVDGGGIESLQEWLPNTALVELPQKASADEIFEDWDNMDIHFKNSFEKIEGFRNFDTDTIGLFIDEYRTEMPDKKEYRMAVKQKYEGVPSSGGAFNYDKLNERYSAPEYLKHVSTSSKTVKKNDKLFKVKYSSTGILIQPLERLQKTEIEIFSITGEKVMSRRNNNSSFMISKGMLDSGFYIVKMFNKTREQSEKVIL